MTAIASPIPFYDDAPALEAAAPLEGRCPTGFFLFLLVNATLFIRPSEIAESLEGLPIYEVLVSLCLICSYPAVLQQLRWRSLRSNPATLFVLGLLPAIALSHLSHGNTYEMRTQSFDFLKVVIYYLLLTALVDSRPRLRRFLTTVTVCVTLIASLCLLQYYDVIDIPSLRVLREGAASDPDALGGVTLLRLQAMGIFHDPNDFSLILVVAILAVMHSMIQSTSWIVRAAHLAPLSVLGGAFALTQSRGGFLSLAVGVSVLAVARWGLKRSVPALLIALPVMLILFGGRQTDINLDSNDTSGSRVALWRDSMSFFHQFPFFGNGSNTLADAIGYVSHNSYVHAYAELGFLGGTCFVGACYLLILGLVRCTTTDLGDSGLAGWRPCVLAIVAAYTAGLFSLTRLYSSPTYLALGMGTSYLGIVRNSGGTVVPKHVFRRTVLVSCGCIVFLHVFIRIVV
jgi:O-antigen ligase